jgi:hypothetical protein
VKITRKQNVIAAAVVVVLLGVGAAPAWAQAPQETAGDSKGKKGAQEPEAGDESGAALHKAARNPVAIFTAGAASAWAQAPQKVAHTAAKPVAQQPAAGAAGHDAAELAKKLSNPIASLISFPIQANFDLHMGTDSGWRMTMNVQPVIPVALNPKWNLISRTILPIIHQGSVAAPGTSQSGLGDIVQSIFISPNKSEPFIWGAGPVILIPTATDKLLGSKQLGLGPTFVVLKQQRGWTVGMLYNHIWRVSGGEGRPNVNSDFIQPFLSYGTKDGWTYSLNTETTYDWTHNHWAVPIHFQISKVVRFGTQPMSLGGALRCWATSPSGGPQGCGIRMVVTALFPKKG